MTPALSSGSENFSFDQIRTATGKQVAYLRDLFIHLHREEPIDTVMQRWAGLTVVEATGQIRGYLKALGRPDENLYPEYGTAAYEALSAAGKEFADTGGMPDSVFEYGFRLKENAPR